MGSEDIFVPPAMHPRIRSNNKKCIKNLKSRGDT